MLRQGGKFFRLIAGFLRLRYFQALYGKGCIAASVISKGVNISVTDGGAIELGYQTSIGSNASLIVKEGRLKIGAGSYIGIGSFICARESIRIGCNTLVAEYVTIRDQDHSIDSIPYKKAGFKTAPIVIGNNVWLGAKVTVTKGVTIGDNSVIGANSVVTRDIPNDVIAVGVPAQIIRRLPSNAYDD